MVGDRVAHAVVLLSPRTAAEEAVVPAVALPDERPLDRVPGVPATAVPVAVREKEIPVGEGADDGTAIVRERRHVAQDVDDDARPRSISVEEIARVEEVPGSVVVEKRMRVDRERVIGIEDPAAVSERPTRVVGDRDAELVPLAVGSAGRV